MLDGGTIAIGGNIDWETTGASITAPDIAVIIRPGALLDASGTHAVIDVQGPNGFVGNRRGQQWWHHRAEVVAQPVSRRHDAGAGRWRRRGGRRFGDRTGNAGAQRERGGG